ncbi:hypothetical protein ACFQH1_11335 [Lactiplantibacillus daoliensis]|uniref:Uncharacterized protein n=1 Tax=Lactiplantibacillus daoliensis TaxID=2559916 RepID=A0ABW1UJG5_9LACO|nr:hypothetical protein [Lactiplantibacillus daoliensis]
MLQKNIVRNTDNNFKMGFEFILDPNGYIEVYTNETAVKIYSLSDDIPTIVKVVVDVRLINEYVKSGFHHPKRLNQFDSLNKMTIGNNEIALHGPYSIYYADVDPFVSTFPRIYIISSNV